MKLLPSVVSCLLLGCAGVSSVTPTPAEAQTCTICGAGVTVSPATVSVAAGGAQGFACGVSCYCDKTCSWSVQESGGGTIGSGGAYTAPSTPGTYHVVATSNAEPTQTAVATITVVAPNLGNWVNVTPSSIDLVQAHFSTDNFGIQDVVVDPAKPSDLYAFVCHQGIWKSTDYGLTWTGPINTGANGGLVTAGKPWTAAIANASASTPPTIWTTAGQAGQKVLKSTDGGVSWTAYSTNNAQANASRSGSGNDVYALDVDPYDSSHLLAGFHEAAGLSESTDGGVTWHDITVPATSGVSLYPFFIDTGVAATTRQTFIIVAQITGGSAGTWRTADAGVSWTLVDKGEHSHGNEQIFQQDGVVYLPQVYSALGWGVLKSTDLGITWTRVNNGAAQSGVVGTGTKLYASWAPAGPGIQTAPKAAGTPWTNQTTPAALNQGWKRAAATFDGTRWIIVSGNWNAGIWRYAEP